MPIFLASSWIASSPPRLRSSGAEEGNDDSEGATRLARGVLTR
eukprot:CAMPEP_0177617116 /NCGR_PEP_ID=MMETSP0419_2-20121207/24655_1 /TAXON_ID=582737 /ORGANISM="Tetraselmis sp., Strain GSL018" /LENGTH=42 /DNA_ID= /DNA_START= /DNA_END= /DNA_ORIENTATION=